MRLRPTPNDRLAAAANPFVSPVCESLRLVDKRFVTFLLLSVLIIVGHVVIQSIFFPPQREVVRQDEGADQPDAEDESSAKGPSSKGEDSAKPAQKKVADGQKLATSPEGSKDAVAADTSAEKPPETGKEPALPAAKSAPAEPTEPEQWFTMGSFDPARGCRLLITLTNRGAAVHRVELVERDQKGRLRYRDLIHTHGYLGAFVRDTPKGCMFKIVGPGTPADLAIPASGGAAKGIQVDDILVSVDGKAIGSKAEFDDYLKRTKVGRKVTFALQRDATTVQLTATLDRWPLQLVQPEAPPRSKTEIGRARDALLVPGVAGDENRSTPSCLLGLNSVGNSVRARSQAELQGLTSLRDSVWKVTQPNEREILFSKRVPLAEAQGGGELEFQKRYQLADPQGQVAGDKQAGDKQASGKPDAAEIANAAYHLQMDIEIQNHGTQEQTVSYVMDGPNGLPLEGWWYTNKIHPSWGSAGARDVVWRVHGNKHSLRSATQIYKLWKEDKDDPAAAITSILTDSPAAPERTLDYLGVDTQYFSAVLLAGTMSDPMAFTCQQAYSMPVGKVTELTGRGMKKLNTSYRMVSVATPIAAGKSVVDQYHLFLGPKSPEVLATYDLSKMIEYGWFGKIAKPLSWLLHLFYGIILNYGLAIVLLTVLVRGAMFPIGRKAARNAQVMQELAPEIKLIKEKYKNDLEKQGQAQRELWKRHNFNPLSGCWLMFLQLPIFIGLYRCLSVDINLRQAPLLPGIEWCSNLSGPDMAWRWQGILPDFFASETGWLGPYLNILPIITIVLFIAQQKMFTPPATDDQTRMQQKMMKYMMIFMGVMFFKVPAGLCVYFIASSLWGIGERKLLPKPDMTKKTEPTPKKKSLIERLTKKEEPDRAEIARQRKKRRKNSN